MDEVIAAELQHSVNEEKAESKDNGEPNGDGKPKPRSDHSEIEAGPNGIEEPIAKPMERVSLRQYADDGRYDETKTRRK